MTHPQLTDEAVSGLPLHGARADLLEEIVAVPRVVATPDRDAPRTWPAPLAAAAAVVALIGGGAWVVRDLATVSQPMTVVGEPVVEDGTLLEAEGWSLADKAVGGASVEYATADGRSLEVMRRPESVYASVVADRWRIGGGVPVRVLGTAGGSWSYTGIDHMALSEPVHGWFVEVRGVGMGAQDFRDTVEQLVRVDQAALDAAVVDPDVMSSAEVNRRVVSLAQTLPAPPGWDYVRPTSTTRPELVRAAVVSVACGWLLAWDEPNVVVSQEQARRVLADAGDWALLDAPGFPTDTAAALERLADRASSGVDLTGRGAPLGCG